MFRKLVSNLSLSPSVAGQLTFYARRLRGERVTRGLSAALAVLLIGLQFVTVVAPPVSANASSPNNVIFSGVSSVSDLLRVYDNGSGTPGQSAAQIQAIFTYFGISRSDLAATHSGNVNSRDHSLLSLGRIQHLPSDQHLVIGGQDLWLRGLYTWDTGSNIANGSNYSAFIGTRSSDKDYFAVLVDCGNLVVHSIPAPKPSPTPVPTPTPTPRATPTPTPTPTPTATPLSQSISCLSLTASPTNGVLPVTTTFTAHGQATNQTITEYEFNFGDSHQSTSTASSLTHTYATTGNYTAYVQIKGSSGTLTPTSAVCSVTVSVVNTPPNITPSKSAINLTQANIDATTTRANAGDVIRYTLVTKNTGGSPQKDFILTEHLEDILEYANVTDAGGATLADGILTWPATTIAANSTLSKTFTVTVKSPVPNTPVSSSDPQSFDLNMDNVYGNLVRVPIAPPAPKQLEAAAAALPQTGGGTSLVIVLAFVGLVIYFYSRNRQLITEIKLLRHEYQGGGSQ